MDLWSEEVVCRTVWVRRVVVGIGASTQRSLIVWGFMVTWKRDELTLVAIEGSAIVDASLS